MSFIFSSKQIPAVHSILNAQALSNEVPQIIALLVCPRNEEEKMRKVEQL